MTTIHKFPLKAAADQVVNIPCLHSIDILHADWQNGRVYLWVRIDPAGPVLPFRVYVRNTGAPMGEAELGAEHISTVLVHGGAQVLHVFVRKGPHIRVRGRLTS